MVVDTLMLMALGAALWRRPCIVTVLLALSYAVGVLLADIRHHDALRPLLIANDAFLVATVGMARGGREQQLARLVASFSMVSIAVGLSAAMGGWRWNTYAAAVNVIAVKQALFAGGFFDGLLAWLGGRNRSLVARPHLLRGSVGGWQ